MHIDSWAGQDGGLLHILKTAPGSTEYRHIDRTGQTGRPPGILKAMSGVEEDNNTTQGMKTMDTMLGVRKTAIPRKA